MSLTLLYILHSDNLSDSLWKESWLTTKKGRKRRGNHKPINYLNNFPDKFKQGSGSSEVHSGQDHTYTCTTVGKKEKMHSRFSLDTDSALINSCESIQWGAKLQLGHTHHQRTYISHTLTHPDQIFRNLKKIHQCVLFLTYIRMNAKLERKKQKEYGTRAPCLLGTTSPLYQTIMKVDRAWYSSVPKNYSKTINKQPNLERWNASIKHFEKVWLKLKILTEKSLLH